MVKVRNKIFLFFLLLISLGAYCQQEQQYTQYKVNPFTINPALGGTEDFVDFKLGYRSQWVGLESAPVTYYLTGHTTVGKEYNSNSYHHKHEHAGWHGLGGYVFRDQTGPVSKNGFYMQYAYNFPLSSKVRLSAGTFLGIKNYQYDYSGLRREDYSDIAIPFGKKNKVLPDMSLGTWLYSKDWYFGSSIFQVFQNDVELGQVVSNGVNSGNLIFHYFITWGGRLPASEHINVLPSFALKKAYPAPSSLDLNMKIDYDDQYFAGVSYRIGDSFAGIVGLVVNEMFEVSYSYDVITSVINKVSSGSHEVIVGLRLKHKNHVICASRFW